MSILEKQKGLGKLHFKFGVMGSAKTANLIASGHSYTEQGKGVLYYKPARDTRDKDVIKSRAVKDQVECKSIKPEDDMYSIMKKDITEYNNKTGKVVNFILLDEAQFYTPKQVKDIRKLVNEIRVNVFAYGLKNSYIDGELFPGSIALLYYSDKIMEIPTSCSVCESKATMNLLVENGEPILTGDDMIVIGDVSNSTVNLEDIKPIEQIFVPVCPYHYHNITQEEIKEYLNR